MTLTIAKYISELLYEHEVVIIPGLGAFIGTYKPAAIDYVQGRIYSPSRNIIFNENMISDDGVLVDFLKHKAQLTSSEASEAIAHFVRESKEVLAKKELLLFPELGRMYRDFEDKIQFLPDNTNFNTDAFGLPTVQFYPVFRERPISAQAPSAIPQYLESSPSAIPTTFIEPAPASPTTLWDKTLAMLPKPYMIPSAAAIGLLLLSTCIYLYKSNVTASGDGVLKLPVTMPRVNEKPSYEASAEDISTEDMIVDIGKNEGASQAKKATPKSNPVEKEPSHVQHDNTTSPKQSKPIFKDNLATCVVIVGKFKDASNVQRMSSKLKKAGYQVFRQKDGNTTRLGASFKYQNDSEKQRKVIDIKKKFNDQAWVMD